jgi:hypothetical protein
MWGLVTQEGPEGELTSRAGGEGLYEGGVFWADAIKEMRDDPEKRLSFAKRHLPLPAAFREAAIALRSIIRTRRKSKSPVESQLSELHFLAAIASLGVYDDLDATAYTKVTALDLTPSSLGWDELPLLTASDRKWMTEAWSPPVQHTTAYAAYPDFFGVGSKTHQYHLEQSARASEPKAERPFQPRQTRAPQPSGSTYTLGLAGESFGDRQSEIRRCREGDEVRLVREPSNPHDPSAIRCETTRGKAIGMISRDNASWLAGRMDRGDHVRALIREICGQPGTSNKGVVIDCLLNGGDSRTPEPRKKGFFARLFG